MSFMVPDWPLPPGVQAVQTTRSGGVSLAPYASLNLALHVGDDPAHVQANRRLLRQHLALPGEPLWLEQVHGTEVYRVQDANPPTHAPRADAAYTTQSGVVLAIMTADCLPLLFAAQDGSEIAAAHAGWRGLAAGVLENTLHQFQAPPGEICVWLGPAISQTAFEVGDEVRAAFVQHDGETEAAFIPGSRSGHWQADLYALARLRLRAVGVTQVYGGNLCCYQDSARFYSYRRETPTGRMASLIWRT
ncbi:MAG: peptidoglycan editing factor PgeF [Pseudomonadota bacterium]